MSNFTILDECNAFLLRYSEIGLKGGNRKMFEKRLLANIRRKIKEKVSGCDFYISMGRFALKKADGSNFEDFEQEDIADALSHTFGLESYSPAIICRPQPAEIEKICNNTFVPVLTTRRKAAGRDNISFCIRMRRSWKKFPFTSREFEIHLAEQLLPQVEDVKVQLKDPEMTLGVEVREDICFVYYETVKGPGGLPVGTANEVLALLSAGIDSPVACYQAMKRGSHIDAITFHSFPYTQPELIDKVRKTLNIVDEWGDTKAKLYSCNMVEAQKMIRDNTKERFRTILYRRFMMRVATIVAAYQKNRYLLTGESVGQVASQTLVNMDTINRATDCLVLRPLSNMDKNDIMTLARKVGTMDISEIQCADSCTTFAPDSPATSAHYWLVDHEESRLDYDEAVRTCLRDVTLYTRKGEEIEVPLLMEIFETHFAGRWGQPVEFEKTKVKRAF